MSFPKYMLKKDRYMKMEENLAEFFKEAKTIHQASATYGTRAKRGKWNDFQWHAE